MAEVLATALAGMRHDIARMEQIAMNISNVATPGYKRSLVVANSSLTSPASFGGLWSAEMEQQLSRAGAVQEQKQVDMRPGTLKLSGQGLDLALSGPGFFEIQTSHGSAYTRQGNFRTDERGRMVTAQGYPVMSKNGDLFLSMPHPFIDADGHVIEGKRQVGQLKIVQFDHPQSLQRLGDGLYAPGEGMRQLPDGEIGLRQGYLENSNVSSAHEMVQMMQTMRHFESMQKMTQAYDDMIGNAIRKLGEM